MKLSDYIADFLVKEGITHTFGITGGSIVHVLDSISRNPELKHIPTAHEQAAAMAADAYSRLTGNFGVAITTSGPGATNLITGTCCSYFDSIPVLCLTGQEVRAQLKKDFQVRQIGFQETDVVSLFKSITKHAKLADDPERIKYDLEEAVYIAKSGRPGPVLLDIPDDIQRCEVEPLKLQSYTPERKIINKQDLEKKVDYAVEILKNSERPVIILGNGVKLGKAEEKAKTLVERLKIPVALTWAARDIFSYDHPLIIENFGVSAGRSGNFAVQNSDFILAFGTRLDTHETGTRIPTFAREAKKVVVDIDKGELDKYEKRGMKVDLAINYDVNDFLDIILEKEIKTRNYSSWINRVNEWKIKYPICKPEYFEQRDKINPYVFMDFLSRESKEGDIIITDAGANLTWTMQGFRAKQGQKIFSAFNHSPMGYSLPASMGAYFATGKPITCITGDGSIQMNIQEFSTIRKHNLPIKIFLINNNGYGIIQQTQDTWLNSRYFASNPDTGVAFPDFIKVSEAYGIPARNIANHKNLKEIIREVLDYNGPILCNIEVEQHEKITPKLEFGKPIEELSPLLDRETLSNEMIIKPYEQK